MTGRDSDRDWSLWTLRLLRVAEPTVRLSTLRHARALPCDSGVCHGAGLGSIAWPELTHIYDLTRTRSNPSPRYVRGAGAAYIESMPACNDVGARIVRWNAAATRVCVGVQAPVHATPVRAVMSAGKHRGTTETLVFGKFVHSKLSVTVLRFIHLICHQDQRRRHGTFTPTAPLPPRSHAGPSTSTSHHSHLLNIN